MQSQVVGALALVDVVGVQPHLPVHPVQVDALTIAQGPSDDLGQQRVTKPYGVVLEVLNDAFRFRPIQCRRNLVRRDPTPLRQLIEHWKCQRRPRNGQDLGELPCVVRHAVPGPRQRCSEPRVGADMPLRPLEGK
ncbi:MAG: hypothetical protein WAR57_06295 [Candidatus Phosphoribacter sp.]